MKGHSKIMAGAVAASVGAVVLVGAPANAQPATARAAAVRTAALRVQQVDNTSDAKALEGQTDKLNQLLQTFIADTGFGTGQGNIPKAKLTTLLVNMITQNDPSLAPEVALKTAGALADLINVAMALNTKDISTLVEQSGPLSAAVTEIAGETAAGQGPSPDAIAKLLKAGGPAATALLSLLISGLTAYEAAPNLPQLTDVLNVIDPLSTDGSKVFHALPSPLQVPEVEAALHVVADFGRTLASINIIKVLTVAQHFAGLLPQSS